jgi:magnesium-transporting ATPase (P-type)
LSYDIFTTFSFAIINLYFSERKVNWTVTKEIFKLIFIVFVCAILSYFYNTLIVSKVEISFFNFLFMIFYAFSVAIPLCLIYVLTRFIYLNNENEKKAQQISQKLEFLNEKPSYENLKNKINIQGKIFEEENLLFLESTDNYCTIYHRKNSTIEKVLLRTTLKSVEEQISSKKILRCHRSYIVNLEKIESLKGNAQGYKLKIFDSNYIVPVSRKYLNLINEVFNK